MNNYNVNLAFFRFKAISELYKKRFFKTLVPLNNQYFNKLNILFEVAKEEGLKVDVLDIVYEDELKYALMVIN